MQSLPATKPDFLLCTQNSSLASSVSTSSSHEPSLVLLSLAVVYYCIYEQYIVSSSSRHYSKISKLLYTHSSSEGIYMHRSKSPKLIIWKVHHSRSCCLHFISRSIPRLQEQVPGLPSLFSCVYFPPSLPWIYCLSNQLCTLLWASQGIDHTSAHQRALIRCACRSPSRWPCDILGIQFSGTCW